MSDAPPGATPAELPAWPFVALFAGYPLWWVLGLGAFAPALCAVPMLALLAVRGRVRVPRGFALWAGFLLFALTSSVMLTDALDLVGFTVRMSSYLAATVVFVYVYNSSERTLPRRRVLAGVCAFLAFVVLGGWLGVLFPQARLDTPLAAVLPSVLLDNEYVRALVRPAMAEVQQPWGSLRVFARPSAPFAYTNGWGANVALLVPFALAALAHLRSRTARGAVAVVLLAAVVPAAATLNRGLYVALAAGMLYAAVRSLLRGRLLPVLALAALATVGAVLVPLTGITAAMQTRLFYSGTNVGRATIYREAFDGTLESPLLGHGGPRPSDVLDISVGTQGQVWNVMFSYGFPALALFVGWFLYAAVRSRHDDVANGGWVHVVLVVTVVTLLYYGYDGPQLTVAMVAAALALRARDGVGHDVAAEPPDAPRPPARVGMVTS